MDRASWERKIRDLSDTLIYELVKALGRPGSKGVERMARLFFGRAARKVAELGLEIDRVVAEGGLAAGARWLLPRFVRSHEARGVENIPPTGPLVIAANHPAAYDSLVISAYVNRPDYKVIIGDIPFFERLPAISERAIYAPPPNDVQGRMQVIRKSIRHLKDGGALLIFARGGIEPDPAFMPNADAEFDHWSRSLEIFLDRVPGTRALVTIVSGVISKAAMSHPITRFRRLRPDRQRLAFMYQIVRQMLSGKELFGLTPRVTFGDLISEESAGGRERMLPEIIQSAQRVLQQHVANEA
jgi:hypothetical protein